MRKLTATLVLILACATSLLLLAQTPPKPPDPANRAQHRVKYLTTVLNLTTAQQQQATTIFTNAGNSEATLHQDMRTAHENLNTAVRSNDSAAIDQASAKIGDLMAQLTSLNAKADAAFYQILTPDQQSKWTQLESEGPRFIMHGMRGGPPSGMMEHHPPQ